MYITRCEAVAILLASGLCEVNVESRKNCGWAGITKVQCENRGCCFNSNFVKSKWCFYKDISNSQCSVNPENRKECGWPGITKEQCESKPGCCFNNKTPGTKWCYYERIFKDMPKREITGSCEVNVESRINCGWGGITRQQCESRGCCFNSNFVHSNWCFYKDISNSRCSVNPENRKECGWPGISKEQCESKPGCCFNNKTPGMKWCYYERNIKETTIAATTPPPPPPKIATTASGHFGGICHRNFKKLGCVSRNWSKLTDLLVTDLDPTHDNFTVAMNWDNYKLGLHSLACRCGEKAKGHYKYFALGFYGECVAGKDNAAIEKLLAENTKSDHGCVNGEYSKCDKTHEKECIGIADYDFIYEII